MHVCIIGTGTSGWLVANQLKEIDVINKITVIGSSKIPHIGVGESTTLTLPKAHKKFNLDIPEFVKETNAAVKYGVYYRGWSSRNFLHYFKSDLPFVRAETSARRYSMVLANKHKNTHIHDLMGRYLWEDVNRNLVYYDEKDQEEYPRTWHFDAGLYINYLQKIALKCDKVNLIDSAVTKVVFKNKNQFIENLILEDNTLIKADYYVNATGIQENKNIFEERFDNLSHYLLTDKAVVGALEYTDKRAQFHPYTEARALSNGWQWITPTWDRIGTGYVFSSNHISVDQAVNEFKKSVNNKNIEPKIVDFIPQINKQTFKINHCSVGMSNGFLEPLDAPGLATTNAITAKLEVLLKRNHYYLKNYNFDLISGQKQYINDVNVANFASREVYNFWVVFILNQYKTSFRTDSKFWEDHRNVENEYWNIGLGNMHKFFDIHKNDFDVMMLAQTTAGKDLNFNSITNIKPFPLSEVKPTKVQHHLDFISQFH